MTENSSETERLLSAAARRRTLAIDYLNDCRHPMDGKNVSIQHRDIKPENVLLLQDVVKVGDFGLVRVLEGTLGTIRGASAGYTPHYAAPELFTKQVSRWIDQYSFALTYHKLRTGQMPFDATRRHNELMEIHQKGQLDYSLLPVAERKVIKRATSIEPEHGMRVVWQWWRT
jgi:serine/threonine protein kinase